MMQLYFLSLVYMLLSSLLLLQNRYRLQLSFLLRFSSRLSSEKKTLVLFSLSGGVISVLMLIFPVWPGPAVLGDLVPAVTVLYEAVWFYVTNVRLMDGGVGGLMDPGKEGCRTAMGWAGLAVAALHFVFPSFVLI